MLISDRKQKKEILKGTPLSILLGSHVNQQTMGGGILEGLNGEGEMTIRVGVSDNFDPYLHHQLALVHLIKCRLGGLYVHTLAWIDRVPGGNRSPIGHSSDVTGPDPEPEGVQGPEMGQIVDQKGVGATREGIAIIIELNWEGIFEESMGAERAKIPRRRSSRSNCGVRTQN